MYPSIFAIALARSGSLDLIEELVRRNAGRPLPPRPPRRRFRRLLGRALGAAGRGLARLGERMASESVNPPLPLGCG